jgi:hypothetical protein
MGESNVEVIDQLIEDLTNEGHLTGENRSLAVIARNLARTVDADSRNSALWAQFRAAEDQLRRLRPPAEETEFQDFIEALKVKAEAYES